MITTQSFMTANRPLPKNEGGFAVRTFGFKKMNTCALLTLLSILLALAYGCTKKSVEAVPVVAPAMPMMMAREMAKAELFPAFNTEEYDRIQDNAFKETLGNPLSTFSIDVDTAAYSNVRRFLAGGQMPPKDAVRIEEMINYFRYDYPVPAGDHPFSITTDMATCPWNGGHRILRIGLQGKPLDYKDLRPCNLVFLIDASGSMADENKLPLLKRSLALMLDALQPDDRVAIVAYAGAAGLVLSSTPAGQKERILSVLEKLQAGGSTAGGQGIALAYQVAKENLLPHGNNRVVLATDGDFNVGVSSTADLVRLIEAKRKEGIYLTICGFGMGNYKDGRMEQISNAGNGNYFYIDNIREAKKVFVTKLRANLFTIAKDVKIQVEFNPAKIAAYRLIGYENRVMAKEDFADDAKDAGELGAGHTVTALYELKMAAPDAGTQATPPLRYQQTILSSGARKSNEALTVSLRYKPLDQEQSRLLAVPVAEKTTHLADTPDDFRFACAVAAFGMLLRESEYIGGFTYDEVLTLARKSKGADENGYRTELVQLIETAELLAKKPARD
jgi:Ca-activated chloride channel family protein